MSDENNDFWVFGYGSLMWNPGFAFVESAQARVYGYHRSLCMISTMYRGNDKNPGLVLGLDVGGSVTGRAFRVAERNVNDVLQYLEDREQITQAYTPHFLKSRLDDGRQVRAYTFVCRHDHRQYAGRLSREKCAHMVATGIGDRGSALDYLASTVEHMDELGIGDSELHKILDAAKKL